MSKRTRRIIVWSVAAVIFYIPVRWVSGSLSDRKPLISPYISYEIAAEYFAGGIMGNPVLIRSVSLNSTITYKEVHVRNKLGSSMELKYSSPIYREQISLNYRVLSKYGIFYSRDPFDILLFRNKVKIDYPVDYWCEPFETIFGDKIFSISYRFKSGIVLQVVNADKANYKIVSDSHRKNCKVARIYFVGEKFRSDFPSACILTESDVQKLKNQNNCKRID